MKLSKYIKKGFLVSIVIAILLFLADNFIFNSEKFEFTTKVLRSFLMYFLYCFVLTIANMTFFDYIDLKSPFKQSPMKRLFYGFFGALLLSLILLYGLYFVSYIYIFGHTVEQFTQINVRPFLIYGLIVTINVNLVFHVIYFYKKNSENKIKASKIVEKTSTAQFESLKNQLDPHFLFNSLNVLTSLIGENPKKAEKFTTKLSKVYRYVLEQRNKELVPVEEEILFAKTYLDLLKMRFEDAIISEISVEAADTELKIIPLSLQLLLENAVKHNVVTSESPLRIKIQIKEGYLSIENNYNPKKTVEKGTKIGLQNIKDRYALLSNAKVIIEENTKLFEVKIPMLLEAGNLQFMNTEEEVDKYTKAKDHVNKIKEFYIGFISYCLVIPGLAIINLITAPSFLWFFFPMAGWGIGIIFQAIKVFGKFSFVWDKWEENKINKIIEEEEQQEKHLKNKMKL